MRATGVSLLVALLVIAGVALPTTADPHSTDLGNDGRVLDAIAGLNAAPPANPGVGPHPSRYDAVRDVAESESIVEPNPWGDTTVTVGVATYEDEPNGVERLAVKQAIAYWNDHAAAHSDYQVDFEYAPGEPRPDITVYYVSHIDNCGLSERGAIILACAPRFDAGERATIPTTIRVRDKRPLSDLRFSVKHEFGHLLGLHHGEGPMPLMAARTAFDPGHAVLDATDRENPWHDPTLSVAVTQDGTYKQSVLEAHVTEALEYYETHSTSWADTAPTFVLVEDPDRADIVLRITREDDCSVGSGYCYSVAGEQLDKDAPLEYYTQFHATFGNIEPRYLSWYTGRLIGYALGAQNESDLPDLFTDPYNAPQRWFDAETRTQSDGSASGVRPRVAPR